MKAKMILKHRGDHDYFLISRTDNSESLVASLNPDDDFEQKLSKENCDELFKHLCYNCQNGCPTCGGYGWYWSSSNEIEVQIETEEGKDSYPGGSELTWYIHKIDSDGCLILKEL